MCILKVAPTFVSMDYIKKCHQIKIIKLIFLGYCVFFIVKFCDNNKMIVVFYFNFQILSFDR